MHSIQLHDGRSCTYQIRESIRARRIRLRLSSREGMVVIIPKGMSTRKDDLEVLIRNKSSWISRHLNRFRSREHSHPSPEMPKLPEFLDFQSIREQWFITYATSPEENDSLVRIRETGPKTLHMTNGLAHPTASVVALQQWVRQRAGRLLPSWLNQISDELALPFSKVTIRNQRSRWGSCTRGKNISLNCKLLFLPRQWTRYVLIHELCHTRIMNHGPEFWTLVRRYEPQAKQIREAMRLAWQELPAWLTTAARNN
ncbi:M48 family metallopeptidase [Desulfonatronum thiosulfatophilum]|nr:YgjP-like metallopeptidase domain-containing protein [Desulfonatronum thiosulfatophilum]